MRQVAESHGGTVRAEGAPGGGNLIRLRLPDRGLPDRGLPDRGLPDRGLPDRGLPDRGLPDRGLPDRASPVPGRPHEQVGAAQASATSGAAQER